MKFSISLQKQGTTQIIVFFYFFFTNSYEIWAFYFFVNDSPTSWERFTPRDWLVTGDGGTIGLTNIWSSFFCLIFDFNSRAFFMRKVHRKENWVRIRFLSIKSSDTCLCSRPLTWAFQKSSLLIDWLHKEQVSWPVLLYLHKKRNKSHREGKTYWPMENLVISRTDRTHLANGDSIRFCFSCFINSRRVVLLPTDFEAI